MTGNVDSLKTSEYRVEFSSDKAKITSSKLSELAAKDVKQHRDEGMSKIRWGSAKTGFGLAVSTLFIAKVVTIAAGVAVLGLTAMTPVGWAFAALGFVIGLYTLYKGIKQMKTGYGMARFKVSSEELEDAKKKLDGREIDQISKKSELDKKLPLLNKTLAGKGASFEIVNGKYKFLVTPAHAAEGGFTIENMQEGAKIFFNNAQAYNEEVDNIAKDQAQYEHDKAHLDSLNKGRKGHMNIMFQGTSCLLLGAGVGSAISSGAIMALSQVPGHHGLIVDKGPLSHPIQTAKGFFQNLPLEKFKDLVIHVPKII